MPKRGNRESSGNICPVCGTPTQPFKTWQLVSPLPDGQGRITITIMGSYQCPNCGHKWRGVVSKMKIGENIEIEGGKKQITLSKEGSKPRQSAIIELDLNEIVNEEE